MDLSLSTPVIVVVLVSAAALLALFVALWIRRRRLALARVRPIVVPRYPVVLAHGLLGFGEIGLLGSRHAYFRGVANRLKEAGVEIHCPSVPALGSVGKRAERLAKFIRDLPAKRVNVIAHSMGGLDARYALARLGIADRVASLITIGTPHRGTPLADINMLSTILKRVVGAAGFDPDIATTFRTSEMETFNREIEDVPGVTYGCVVALGPKKRRRMNPVLLPAYVYLSLRGGANDGLVPASSQRWGDLICEIHADHWAQIGWSSSFDAVSFYGDLLRELRVRGF